MNISALIKAIVIVALALFVATYLGISTATAQYETIAWVVGGVTLIGCLLLGRDIWLLIPFLAAVNIQVRVAGQPNTLMIGQALLLGFSVLLVATRKINLSTRLSELEWWMIGLGVLMAQVYARNPAGIWLFQSDVVGGKAYFVFVLAFLAALLLCCIHVQPRQLKKVFPLVVVGSIINVVTGVLGLFFPVVGFYTGANYSTEQSNVGGSADSGRATRLSEVSTFGHRLATWVSALKNPLRAALSPFWLFLILLSIACALIGGFRSGLAAAILSYIVGTAYRGGFGALLLGGALGVGGIALLAVVNLVAPLPPNVQRSLTFLPGTWDQRYVDDAKNSTEWRVEVWKEVLLTDRWIQNKFMGDGLGFNKQQLAYQLTLNDKQTTRKGISGMDLHREGVLVSGDYHSGPVSTIRVIGYVGLAFLIFFQIRLAVHAHRQILRCRNTEWQPLAMLIGIPLVWGPVFFHFIFGDFRSEAIALLMGAAMVRILERSLPLPAYAPQRRLSPPIPAAIRNGIAARA